MTKLSAQSDSTANYSNLKKGYKGNYREIRPLVLMMMMMMMMNLYSSQREICLGQRFTTKILTDISFIHTCTYLQK